MHLAIDASNIRQGGGLTHLSQVLRVADPPSLGIQKVSVWVNSSVAAILPSRPWLTIYSANWMDGSLPVRAVGQQFRLPTEFRKAACDLLLSPGGSLSFSQSLPAVTISQNMLPFEPHERRRFPLGLTRGKLKLLEMSQRRSFQRSSGIIFLSDYAKSQLTTQLHLANIPAAIIPHGIEDRFRMAPRQQRALAECSAAKPFRLLYVSIAMPYKHQIEVALAVHRLVQQGIPISIEFVGQSWGQYGDALSDKLKELDPECRYLIWRGEKPFLELHEDYRSADAFVFASSCENLPNILIEAMSAGLPCACANKGPMPEVLKAGGVYFDPENIDSIASTITHLAEDDALRSHLADRVYGYSQKYSWEVCAHDTFEFLAQVGRDVLKNSNKGQG